TLPTGQRARLPIQLATVGTLVTLLLAGLATSRILGGAPVQFAGGGASVVEFRVEVGEELQFTLCEGGRDPRVEVLLEQEGCRLPGCSLAGVIDALVPCAQGMSRSDCPGDFRWTPQFYDGSRDGTSYELTVACMAEGPPASHDRRRIRLVVSRPNSPPQFNLLQLSDGASELVIPIPADRQVEIPAGGNITIQAFARDDDDIDDRVLEFKLVPDNDPTESMTSLDGRFTLGELDWSEEGEWSATISVSDKVAPPVEKR